MGDPEKGKSGRESAVKVLRRVASAVVGLLLFLAVACAIYLSTPFPARQLSRLATSYLQQDFSIDQLQISGATLYLKGVRLRNPEGFPSGVMEAARTVAIAPQWADLLFGRPRFRLVALDGVSIALDKNGQGTWNFAQLQW